MRMYEELGAIGLCTAYIAKSPLFRSRILNNFFLGFGVHIGSSIAVYLLAQKFIRTVIEPKFVVKDSLVGELAEKYNFTIEDFSEIKEEIQENNILDMLKKQMKGLF